MVTFRPIGRLGNNMFQTAACIAYAKKYGYEWRVPTTRYNGDNDPWLLTKFWPDLPTTEHRWIGERYEQYDPKDFNYKPIPNIGRATLLGFFQSEKFFEGFHNEVRASFPLVYHTAFKEMISIHIRRGDYVNNSNSFPPIKKEYILKALDCLPKGHRKIIFSDDPHWCKEEYPEFEICYESDEYQSLCYMASCSHHIIANSTFSWWGAWLGFNPNRIVVSPHYTQWFGPAWTGKPPIDLIPEKWVQIKI